MLEINKKKNQYNQDILGRVNGSTEQTAEDVVQMRQKG
jgi:hypothetical protein